MKTELPGNAKIAKDAKESIQECVSEFISFITSEASDKCLQEKRKTINGDDLLWAMSTLGFDKYIDPLKLYLSKYRDSVKGEKPEKKPSAASMRKSDQGSSSSTSNQQQQQQHHNMPMNSLLNMNNNTNPHMNTMNMNNMHNNNMNTTNTMHNISHSSNLLNDNNNMNMNNTTNMNMLPSVSNITGYNNYDNTMNNTNNSLLISGNIETSPLFLNANNNNKINNDTLLPPLPKKRDLTATTSSNAADISNYLPGTGNNMSNMNTSTSGINNNSNITMNMQKKHKTT